MNKILFIIIAIIVSVVDAFGLKIVWNWFIPQMFGLLQLNMFSSFILLLVIRYLTTSRIYKEQDDEEYLMSIVYSLSYTLIFIAIGFIVKIILF